jgi:hypothetical protein
MYVHSGIIVAPLFAEWIYLSAINLAVMPTIPLLNVAPCDHQRCQSIYVKVNLPVAEKDRTISTKPT